MYLSLGMASRKQGWRAHGSASAALQGGKGGKGRRCSGWLYSVHPQRETPSWMRQYGAGSNSCLFSVECGRVPFLIPTHTPIATDQRPPPCVIVSARGSGEREHHQKP